jgi:hypothetical protein
MDGVTGEEATNRKSSEHFYAPAPNFFIAFVIADTSLGGRFRALVVHPLYPFRSTFIPSGQAVRLKKQRQGTQSFYYKFVRVINHPGASVVVRNIFQHSKANNFKVFFHLWLSLRNFDAG